MINDDDDFSLEEIDESLNDIDDGDSYYSEPTQDFTSDRPLDFSQDQMNIVSTIHKKFAELSANNLSDKLNLTVIIDVNSVYELTTEEFCLYILHPTVLGVINMAPLKGSAIMEINPAISSAIINRLGKIESSESQFELTDNGKKIMEGIFTGLLENLSSAWSSVTDLRPQLEKIETNPTSIRLIPPEEKLVIVEMEVDILDPEMEEDMEDTEGTINICIPYPVIEPVTGKPILGKLILEDGSFYEGDYVKDNFNGKGKVTSGYSMVYEGDFVDGKQTGKGKLTFPGGMYEGDFVDGKHHGNGKLTFNDGDVYEGDFVDDKKHGKGKYTWANGDIYEGDFADGYFQGKGKKTYAEGGTDEGDYVEDNLHGKGKQILPDGGFYEGDFLDGKQHGKGKYTYADGNVYEGDWEEGNFHGKGKFTYADGTFDEGDFIDGNLHGKGKRKFTNGIFEGEFVDDEPHGKGKLTFTDGRIFIGDYVNGERSCKGKMTYPDGRVEEGEWKDGEFVQ